MFFLAELVVVSGIKYIDFNSGNICAWPSIQNYSSTCNDMSSSSSRFEPNKPFLAIPPTELHYSNRY